MRKSKYNSSGAGPKPTLGVGKPRISSRPESGRSGNGIHAGRGTSPKAARPGGATKSVQGRGPGYGSVARPGGPEGISR